MDKQDITKLLKIIKVTYSYAFKDYSSADANLLINIWYNELKDYPTRVVEQALSEALKICRTPPTIADIISIIDKQERAMMPTNNQLWDILYKAINATENQVSRFGYTFMENGKTQGEIAREKVNEIFNNLPPVIKIYVASVEQLINLSYLEYEELQFEKARFMKNADSLYEIIKVRNRLELGSQNIGLLEE